MIYLKTLIVLARRLKKFIDNNFNLKFINILFPEPIRSNIDKIFFKALSILLL